MKKLFFAALAAATLGLTACSQADKAKEEAGDFKSKIENCTNTDSLAVYVQQAQEYADKLVKEGKIEEAQKYLADIQPLVEEKAPGLVSAFDAVKSAIDKLPTSAEAAKDAAVEKANEAKDAAVDSLKSAADNAKEAAKAKVDEATNKAADKANKAVQDGADKAKDKINNLLGK